MFVGIYFILIASCSLDLTNGRVPNKDDPDNTKIIFPGPIQDLSDRYDAQNVTDPCKGLDYCTIKPKDYPQELFNKMFKGKYKEPIFQPTYIMTDNRQGDPDEKDDCDSTVTYEPLYKVRTQAGDMRTVVQAPEENFLQLVRIESCNNAGSSCFNSFRTPADLQTLCKQKYSVWEFLVHDEKDGTEKVKVDLPICCSCHFKPKE